MNRKPHEGEADIRRWLSLLIAQARGGGGVVEVRSLGRVHNGYFDDAEAAVKAVLRLDRVEGVTGTYATVNPVRPELLARAENRARQLHRGDPTTTDAEILRRRFLPIDIDPVRPSGISATDAEKAAALEVAESVRVYLAGLGWPEPIAVDSGSGGHLTFAVDLVNDADSLRLIGRVLEALAARFDTPAARVDTGTRNASRVLKVPGTMARKGDSTADRPHRRSAVTSWPEILVPVGRDQLEALAGPAPEAGPRGKARAVDVEAVLEHLRGLGLDVSEPKETDSRTVWTLTPCPWDPAHDNGAGFVQRFDDGGVIVACHHASCQGKGLRDVAGWEGERKPLPTVSTPSVSIVSSVPTAHTGGDLPRLLDEVTLAYRRFVYLDSPHKYSAITLWTAHTHAMEASNVTPYLHITGPGEGTGKTRVLETMSALAHEPLDAANVSPSAIYVAMETLHPTLLFDEVDSLFRGGQPSEWAEAVRGILNAGYRRSGYVIRSTKTHALEKFSPFGAKVMAGIGDLPRTLADRSVRIKIHRLDPESPEEIVEDYEFDQTQAELSSLKEALASAMAIAVPALRAKPTVKLRGLNPRQREIWRPLFAIADVAGGDWPEKSRKAALALAADIPAETLTLPVQLLMATHEISGRVKEAGTGISTADLIALLRQTEDGPWAEQLEGLGEKSAARRLAKAFKAYDIHPKQVWIGGRNSRGYAWADFAKAWRRYLPPDPEARVHAVGTLETIETLEQPERAVPAPPADPEARAAEDTIRWWRRASYEQRAGQAAYVKEKLKALGRLPTIADAHALFVEYQAANPLEPQEEEETGPQDAGPMADADYWRLALKPDKTPEELAIVNSEGSRRLLESHTKQNKKEGLDDGL